MTRLLVDGAVVLVGIVIALACAQARVNRRIVRAPGFIVGGPETRVPPETHETGGARS